MQATVDKFGRIVIPKKIRDSMGLSVGSVVDIQPGNNELRIKPLAADSYIQKKGDMLVFTGELTENVDIVELIERQRKERDQHILGPISLENSL